MATGSIKTNVENTPVSIDYAGGTANVVMKHKLNQTGLACVPRVDIRIAKADGTCALNLMFETDYTGVGKLSSATFEAKSVIFLGGSAKASKPCVGFLDPYTHSKGHAAMNFTLTGGNGGLPTPLLQQPHAAQTDAKPYVDLSPTGVAKLQFKGISMQVDLTKLRVKGVAQSTGSTNTACTKPKPGVPLPNVVLKDVNTKSKTYGQTVKLSDFAGKYVVVLAGAGWCASCVAQSEYMLKIQKDLHAQGRNDFQMIALNDGSAKSSSQQKMLAAKGKADFPVLQGNSQYGWKSLSDCFGKLGKKNDGFIFAPNGRFIRKHVGKGTVYLNVFEDDVRQALNTNPDKLQGCACKEVSSPPQKVHHTTCK